MFRHFANISLSTGFLFLISFIFTSAAFASGGGGVVGPNPLPQTAPEPGVIYRESFGLGPDIQRPTGGKGTLKPTSLHTPISSFWIEYPGSKNTSWIAPSEGQTWRFCASSDNPYEMYSPI